MKIKIFELKQNEISLVEEEVLLISEFALLWEKDFNKCKEDKTGTKKLVAFKYFKFIYLVYDHKSPYSNLDISERIKTALNDSQLTTSDISQPIVRNAIKTYQKIQETKLTNLLDSAYIVVDKLRNLFLNIDMEAVDVTTGKYLNSAKDVIYNLSNLGKVVDGIQALEYQVKKEQQKEKSIRGDAEPGFFD